MPPNRRQKKNPDVVDSPIPAAGPLSEPSSSQLPSLPAPVEAASEPAGDIDDGDALPAVGKVWDEGPKRSLSQILADQQRSAGPAARPTSAPAALPPDLARLWSRFLEQVQEQLGPGTHVPLSSGNPQRDGERLVVRLTGPGASMAKYLEKNRDQLQKILENVAGQSLALHLEADESAPAAPAPARQATASGANPAKPADPGMAQVAAREGIPLTPDLRAQLEKDPFIRAVMEALNGNIVKVEQTESQKNV